MRLQCRLLMTADPDTPRSSGPAAGVARADIAPTTGQSAGAARLVIQVVVDLVLITAVWCALYFLRAAVLGPCEPTWTNHLLLLLLPVLSYLAVAALQPGWAGAATGSPGTVLRQLAPPVIVVALSPNLLLLIFENPPVVAVPVLIFFGVVMLLVVGVAHVVLLPAPVGTTSAPGQRRLWVLVGGLVCAAAASLVRAERPFGEGLWISLAMLFARDGLRLAAAIAVALFVAASLDPRRWYPASLVRAIRGTSSRAVVVVGALICTVSSGLFAGLVLDRIPHIQDEIAMIFQAKNFAAGQLYARTPALVEFFDQEFILIDGEKWYGKYLAGPAVYYLPGVLFGAPWLVSPICGGLAVIVLFLLARELFGNRLGRLAVMLAVVSPFWMLTFASMMSHPGSLFLLAAFAACLVRAAKEPGRLVSAMIAGLALGVSLHFRVWTAAAISLPVMAAILVSPLRRNIRSGPLAAFILPVAAMIGLFLAYNHALTGDAFLTPFEKYSPNDRLGFGPDKGLETWPARDRGHDLRNAMKNLNLNLEALMTTLFGWPRAAVLLCLLGLLVAPRCARWVLGIAAGTLVTAYFFYHFAGVVYGARYWSEALPAFLILAALGLVVLRGTIQRVLRGQGLCHACARARIGTAVFLFVCVAGNAVGFLPEQIRSYSAGLWGVDAVPRDTVTRAGVENAVILIRTPSYRKARYVLDKYGSGFLLNSPNLDDEVIFARDLGEQKNQELMAYYPDRAFYRFVRLGLGDAKLVPIPRSAEPESHPRE